MRAIVMRAAHTMSLMTLDVPGMHLSMSVVHSTNVSLLRGSGGAVSARATIRQPMTGGLLAVFMGKVRAHQGLSRPRRDASVEITISPAHNAGSVERGD